MWKFTCSFTKWIPSNQFVYANLDYNNQTMTLERFGFVGLDQKCYWGLIGILWTSPLQVEQILPSITAKEQLLSLGRNQFSNTTKVNDNKTQPAVNKTDNEPNTVPSGSNSSDTEGGSESPGPSTKQNQTNEQDKAPLVKLSEPILEHTGSIETHIASNETIQLCLGVRDTPPKEGNVVELTDCSLSYDR